MTGGPGSAVTGVRVVLVGSMAAGKTTVGRALAQRLRVPFVDTDEAIERATGRSVASVFEVDGEAAFRALERAVCVEAIEDPAPGVVSLGGGAFESAPVRDACRTRGARVVWLDVPPEVAVERARAAGPTRPLLEVADPVARLRSLNEVRAERWAKADVKVAGHDRAVDGIVDEIMEYLGV